MRQAKSKQKILDKMEAAGLVEKIEARMSGSILREHMFNHFFSYFTAKQLSFNFEDVRKLPPPIIAFDEVAFSYSGKKADYLYQNLSFGIEFVFQSSAVCVYNNQVPFGYPAWIPV